jgi:hypothetical protein
MPHFAEMSCDSKVFYRGTTRIPVAVCVAFSNGNAIRVKYDELLQAFFSKRGIAKTKDVFNSVDISTIFGEDRSGFLAFLENFTKTISGLEGVHLNVTFSIINSKYLTNERVQYYGAGRSTVKEVPVMKFIDDLSECYPYVGAWAVTKIAKISGTVVHLDDFQGSMTEAWTELKKQNYIQVYPNGDLCRREISTADMIVKYLDEKMWSERSRIDETTFKKILSDLGIENSSIFYVGNPDLAKIVPVEPRSIPMRSLYKRPMVFILKEGIMEHEKEFLETRPESMRVIQKFAASRDTGYKFIAYDKDFGLLDDRDIVIYLGPRGKEQCELFATMGYHLETRSLSELRAP